MLICVRAAGVTRPTGQPYRANICLPGGFQKQIGVYGTAEEAASAYDRYKLRGLSQAGIVHILAWSVHSPMDVCEKKGRG